MKCQVAFYWLSVESRQARGSDAINRVRTLRGAMNCIGEFLCYLLIDERGEILLRLRSSWRRVGGGFF